ncbi:MAG: LptF/LptG family permease [Bacteroidales bacterium]|nr:LptF/LptG family permease [Bacteroidales bacterium]
MKKLHIYILRAFIGPWLITFLLCVFILLMQFLWRYIDDLVGKGLDFSIILELMFYASFSLVPLALPLSGLLASIMAMGKFGETNELFAMKSGGVSLYRIMSPLIVFNLIISICAFFFSNNLMPYTNLKMRSLLFGIQQQRPEVIIQNGIFVEPVDDICIKVDQKTRNNDLNGILIYDHRGASTPNNVTMASSGNILITEDNSMMILELHDGTRHEDVKGNKYQHQNSKFERQITYLELDATGIDKNNEEFFKGGYEMLSNQQLKYTMDSLNEALCNREEEICGNFKRFQIYKGITDVHGVVNGVYSYSKAPPLRITAVDEHVADKIKMDTILAMMDKVQKEQLYEFAVNYSRSANTYLNIVSDEVDGTRRWIVRHEIEWYRKYSLSLACLLFCIIGIPLGSIIRKGGFGLSMVVSVLIFLIYYIVSTTFESTVKELVTPTYFGMWISTLILLPIGIYLVVSVANDNLRINPRVLNKILNVLKLRRKKNSGDGDDE